ncbi:MAG: hypothetical protein HYU66_22055 [Armatimonadetes bacterium]|nr:hypothetical protein [Armatimonadota bacterium]
MPADTFVYFQLLDERGRMVQSMRSGTMVQAGERSGCVGCHESRRAAPALARAPLALGRAPSRLQGWHGEPRLFSYRAEVQPVFDRYCLSCHDWGGSAADKVVLAGDRDLTFNTSYNELWRRGLIKVVGAGPAETQPAYAWGSTTSRLTKVLEADHHGVRVDPESYERVVTWIDLNAPYYPSYATAHPGNLAGRAPLDNVQLKRLSELTGLPFPDLAGFSTNRGPQVSFDRPELSPCLAGLTGDSRREALAIVAAGAAELAARPEADAPGFTPCEADQRREARYAERQAAARRSREAAASGAKAYDPR